MNRSVAIFGGMFALYAVLMSATWVVGTHHAERKTEAMLDYAVHDMRVSLDGVIDTMMEHLASIAVRHFKVASAHSMDEVKAVAEAFDIDELCIVDRTGLIIATNDPDSLGVDMNAKSETRPYSALTNGVTQVVSQPFRRHAYSSSRRKYLGVPFPGGNGYIQIGLDESRMVKMISVQLSFLFDSEVEDTLCYLCAETGTGRLISNKLEPDMPQTLAEMGFDESGFPTAVASLLGDGGVEESKTFVQVVDGRQVYCRCFTFGGHRFIMIEPEDEFYGSRDRIAATMAVLLAVVLLGFAFLILRISGDSERIKAFYAAEEKAREKEMEIAKAIQSSALPVPLDANPHFRLSASMSPAREVGGDFYDFFLIDETHLAFLVADVSGKGVTAALYMMTAKTLLKDALLSSDPATAFSRVNRELCKNNTANMFLTAWGGVLDLETGLVTYVNAGHNPPVKVACRAAEGDGKAGGAPEFVSGGQGPVLAFLDGVRYASRTLSMKPGDTLFLYTDGVTEALDGKGALFGEQRLMDAIGAVQESRPKALCNVVRMAVAAFAEGVPQADDITVLAVEYVSRPQRFVRTFPPTQEGIASASSFLDECVEDGSPLSASLHIVLDEVCSNIVRHAGASGFEIEFEWLADPERIRLTFIDDGEPYDPLSHADPDTSVPLSERAVGGLGILMVKKIADSVGYRRARDRNQLTVVKGVPRHD